MVKFTKEALKGRRQSKNIEDLRFDKKKIKTNSANIKQLFNKKIRSKTPLAEQSKDVNTKHVNLFAQGLRKKDPVKGTTYLRSPTSLKKSKRDKPLR